MEISQSTQLTNSFLHNKNPGQNLTQGESIKILEFIISGFSKIFINWCGLLGRNPILLFKWFVLLKNHSTHISLEHKEREANSVTFNTPKFHVHFWTVLPSCGKLLGSYDPKGASKTTVQYESCLLLEEVKTFGNKT